MKNTDEKIDELARMVAKGFAMSATKDDLAALERKMANKKRLPRNDERIRHCFMDRMFILYLECHYLGRNASSCRG